MREVAIVGAGELGGLIAHAVARQDAADVVRLVDEAGRVAEGKALDIAQAAPVEGFAAAVSGSTDIATATSADIIVFADRAAGGDWQGDDALSMMRRMRAVAPRALVICAGLNHRELVHRSARELHVPRSRIVGSAAEAFAAAARAIVALELDVSPREVALSVLGVPPGAIVIAWEDATVSGLGLREMISDPVRRRLTRRIGALWPVGPYALASAACKVIDASAAGSRRPVICFVAPEDAPGVSTRTAALPVRLGSEGITEVIRPPLSAAERIALENAMLL